MRSERSDSRRQLVISRIGTPSLHQDFLPYFAEDLEDLEDEPVNEPSVFSFPDHRTVIIIIKRTGKDPIFGDKHDGYQKCTCWHTGNMPN